MADYDDALIEKGARALIGAAPDWQPAGDLTEQAWNEAKDDARAVLDAVADDLRAEHSATCATTDQWRDQKARAEKAEAERDHFAQVARDTFQELKTITAERDRAHATTSHEHEMRLNAEAALSRALADMEALADEWDPTPGTPKRIVSWALEAQRKCGRELRERAAEHRDRA